jgi:murein lipoprotein
MRKVLFALTAASLLALSGCATQEAAKPAAPTISAGAQAALTAAQAAVKDAKSKDALWTTAESALKAAEEAAKKGDSAAVITNAEKATSQAKLGLEQKNYPVLQLKNL